MRVTFNELGERELNDAAQVLRARRIWAWPGIQGRDSPLHSIRRRLCQRFPYALLYTVKADELRILALMNLKRRPGYWVGRR